MALSKNDFSQETQETALATSRLGLELMVKQIKATLPKVKIGVIPTPVYGGHVEWWNWQTSTT